MYNSNSNGWQKAARIVVLGLIVAPFLAACGGGNLGAKVKRGAFTSAEYGVKVSPRVTNNPYPPRGGGRYQVGKPYTVRGITFTPKEQPDYVARGVASWYGSDFHGRRTANGEIFSANAITGAHPTLPLPSYVRVTNVSNGRSVLVRINDRGPFVSDRLIDLSHKTADLLELVGHGTAEVEVRYVSPAPLNGDDTRMLMASLNRTTTLERNSGTTRMAMAETPAPALRPSFAQNSPPQPATSKGRYSADDLAKDFLGLFSYADAQQGEAAVFGAHAAVNAMASRADALDEWVSVIDEDARKIHLQLGVFADPDGAIAIAERFALLGAVDEDPVLVGGRPATRLTLTHLKPGVARSDVLTMARDLGLNDLALN